MNELSPIHSFKRKILITGGAGFIASSLAQKLASDKDNLVVIIDNLSTGHLKKLPPLSDNLRFIKGDVNSYHDIAEIMLSYHFHYVFHYAAMVGVQRTQANPIGVLNDLNGIKYICTLSKNMGVRRVFFASSSEIYGEPVEFPQNAHTTPLNSRVPYAVVKNAGEVFLRSYHKEFGLNYTIFRFFNTYGPKQSSSFVISKFLLAALKGQDITIYGDGTQTRTFCYIDDNIDACVKIAYDDLFINDVVNIGNSVERNISSVAKTIVDITKSTSKIVFVPPLKDGDMKRRCPDNSKMLEVIQRPLIKLEDGIQKILDNGFFDFLNLN